MSKSEEFAFVSFEAIQQTSTAPLSVSWRLESLRGAAGFLQGDGNGNAPALDAGGWQSYSQRCSTDFQFARIRIHSPALDGNSSALASSLAIAARHGYILWVAPWLLNSSVHQRRPKSSRVPIHLPRYLASPHRRCRGWLGRSTCIKSVCRLLETCSS